ncbi:HK97 gp10 family phage protein [Haloferula sp. BvORR071]|uniref:HK97 gp10 family phage protein n=1 Tax=Haloferula sp. BvORR071 TaxID=1396141 RepID=UPI000695AC65|nr:HK97 gp10 family phage protein [Haloferula sp. BvORR071]
MKIEVQTSKEAERIEKLVAKFQTLPSEAFEALMYEIGLASLLAASAAVKQRFRGKGPFPVSENRLGVKSGRLSQSIRCTKPQVNLRTGEITVSFGSNVVYFAAHEFGFNGSIGVKAHQRKEKKPRGRLRKSAQAAAKEAAKPLKIVEIRAHNRRMKVPARRPLGTHLESEPTRVAFLLALKRGMQRAVKSLSS